MSWGRPRDRAVGLVVKQNQLLVIKRRYHAQQYYSLPGGGIETGETPEQAAVREVEEETTIIAKPLRAVYHHHYPGKGHHYYILCEYVSGQPQLGQGEERYHHFRGINEYHPQWQDFSSIPSLNLRPHDVYEWLVMDLKGEWPRDLRTDTIHDSRWSHE
jgi:8-oxo-dGTP diphosphatase